MIGTVRTTRRAGSFVAQLAALVLVVVSASTAWSLTANKPAAADLPGCGYSNQVFDSQASLLREKAPTRFKLMTSRYMQMVQAQRGSACSGTVTVAFNGHSYFQAGLSDDPGIVWLITPISSSTGMSLAATFDLTETSLISLGLLIGYAGFRLLFPDPRVRWVGAAVFLCLGLAEVAVADVYIFQTSPLIGGIPWVLYFALRRETFALNASMVLLAFCCSWCSLVRIGTTLICLAFLIPVLAGRYRAQRMLLPLLLIILACAPSLLFERYLIARRNTVLVALGQTTTAVDSHPIWHSIYIGLGFIPNAQVPEYNDAVAINKVRSIDPAAPYTSARYEAILRSEVFRIARESPGLLIENLVAKTGIVVILAAILLFPVRRLLLVERDAIWLDASFVLAIALSAMNAILVIPKPIYLLTFLCLTFLYASTKLCWALSTQIEQDGRSSAMASLVRRLF